MNLLPSRGLCRGLGFAALTALILLLGCGGGRTFPVRGKVVYRDGKPFPGGLVVFQPVDAGNKHSADGEIQPDGRFELRTFHPGDGVVPGKYRALISPPHPAGDRGDKRVPRSKLIAPRYLSFDTSGLEFTVKAESNEFTIEVDRPGR
ncbi:MAG: hypothetical protein L0Z62_44140 [Gemmataceae bacterium]|nr:hypothetical protein [Gemmataceae bacterium]